MSPFHLLNLPSNVQIDVLRSMDCLQQIALSILSERTKSLVISLNLETKRLDVIIGNMSRIEVSFKDLTSFRLFFRRNGNSNLFAKIDDLPDRIGKQAYCRVYDRDDVLVNNQRWKNLRFNIREWIDHFQEILQKPEINRLFFQSQIEQFSIDSLRMTVEGLNVKELRMSFGGSQNYTDMIMETFNRCKILSVEGNSFQYINKILMRNFTVIWLDCPFQWTLDHLLICNAKRLAIRHASLSDKILNQLLKHWRNESIRRMGSMLFQFEENRRLDQNVILKGLDHYVVPPEQERIINGFIMIGGYDIQRCDGTIATIRVQNKDEESSFFRFDVWK